VANLRLTIAVAASALALAALVCSAVAQPNQTLLPPKSAPSSARDTDLGCRKQAAAQTGYRGSNAPEDTERSYAAAYYACMEQAYGPPGPQEGTAYGPPPPPTYSYYQPYPYPYYGPYYYPPYLGPGLSFGLDSTGARAIRFLHMSAARK
jgi:hypothetical protein